MKGYNQFALKCIKMKISRWSRRIQMEQEVRWPWIWKNAMIKIHIHFVFWRANMSMKWKQNWLAINPFSHVPIIDWSSQLLKSSQKWKDICLKTFSAFIDALFGNNLMPWYVVNYEDHHKIEKRWCDVYVWKHIFWLMILCLKTVEVI